MDEKKTGNGQGRLISLDEHRRAAEGPSHQGFACPHKEVIARIRERVVECAACGRELDPFDVILRLVSRLESRFDLKE
jgi:hypothetical protein